MLPYGTQRPIEAMGGNCYTINWRKLLVSIRLGSDWYHYSYTFIRCWRRCFVSFPASNLNLSVSPRGSISTLITQSSRRAFERQSENNVLRSYPRILSPAWNNLVPRAFVITRSRWEPARWLFNTWPSINFSQCFTVKIEDFPCLLRGFLGFNIQWCAYMNGWQMQHIWAQIEGCM